MHLIRSPVRHFPELLQWVSWCYGQHIALVSNGNYKVRSWSPTGQSLGPSIVCLVLQKVVSAIASDSSCSDLLFHAWYIDHGVIAGFKQAVVQAFSIIQDL